MCQANEDQQIAFINMFSIYEDKTPPKNNINNPSNNAIVKPYHTMHTKPYQRLHPHVITLISLTKSFLSKCTKIITCLYCMLYMKYKPHLIV